MSVVVVGGHTRNIGKTGLMVGLITALRQRHWTAIKITQFGHGVCSANGEPCDCETADHTVAMSEERSSDTGTDTSRYLAAGATRSFWVRTRQGQLHEAMPRVRSILNSTENVIIESNSVLRFLRPDVYLCVLDPSVADFKKSSLRFLDRADGLVLRGDVATDSWPLVAPQILRGRRFTLPEGRFCSEEIGAFVCDLLAAPFIRR